MLEIQRTRITYIDKIIAALCVLLVYASPYRLLGLPLPELMAIGTIIICLFYYQKYRKDTNLFLLCGYLLIVPPVVSLLLDYPGNYVISFTNKGLLLFVLFMTFVLPNLNYKLILKYYKFLVYLAIGFYCLQEISYLLIGSRPTLYLPFFEMYYEGSDMVDFSSSRAEMERSSSFFLEPAHFLQYIFPYVCIVAIKTLQNFKDNWKEIVFLTFIVLFARSGCGYFGGVALAIYLLIISKALSAKKKIFIGFGIFAALFVITQYFSNTELVSGLTKRMNQEFALEIDKSSGRSGFIRMYRGYFIYGLLNGWSKFFGVGTGSMEYVCSFYKNPLISYDGTYLNGIQSILMQGGIVGSLLVFFYFRKLCNKWNTVAVAIVIVFFGMCFVESMWLNVKMLLYITIAYSFYRVYGNTKLNELI